MGIRFQQKRDTAANWTSNDPTLLSGEIGFETDTNKFKIGDGSTVWTSLAYAGGVSPDGDVPVTVDSESDTFLIAHAYLTQTAGFVTAGIKGIYELVTGFVGTTNDPAGAGQKVAEERDYNSANALGHIGFFVGNGKYFEITATATPEYITWTPLITGGAAPIDQD